MKFEMSKAGNYLIVRIGGELDHHYCDIIRNRIDPELMEPPIRNIVFDLSGLTFMDSSGIGMLMGRLRIVKAIGGQACLICENPGVLRILEMSGVLNLFTRSKTISDAVKGACVR